MKFYRFIFTFCFLLASSSFLYAVSDSYNEEEFRLSAEIAENPEIKGFLYAFIIGLVLFIIGFFIKSDYNENSKVGYALILLGSLSLFVGSYGVLFVAIILLGVIAVIIYWLAQCFLALFVYILAFTIIPMLILILFGVIFDKAKIKTSFKFPTFFFYFGISVCFILYCMQPSETRDKINFFPKESLFDVIHKAIYKEVPKEDYDIEDYDL